MSFLRGDRSGGEGTALATPRTAARAERIGNDPRLAASHLFKDVYDARCWRPFGSNFIGIHPEKSRLHHLHPDFGPTFHNVFTRTGSPSMPLRGPPVVEQPDDVLLNGEWTLNDLQAHPVHRDSAHHSLLDR